MSRLPALSRLLLFGSFVLAAMFAVRANDALYAQSSSFIRTDSGVTIRCKGADIVLTPLEAGAIRVQIGAAGVSISPQSFILTGAHRSPRFSVHRTSREIVVDTGALHAQVDRETGTLAFTDAAGKTVLQEQAGTRILPPPNAPTGGSTAQDVFVSPPSESLFGTGQFQDGYLNVRDLPRRLTQVNSQISIPFLLSSRGYGLLWHNYGRTDLNPTDIQIELQQVSTYAVTTAIGTQTVQTQEGVFTGSFETANAGTYALMLDVGSKMAKRYHVEIDGKTDMDYSNVWLPPTTSWLRTLAAGKHSVRVIAEATDKPALSLRPANDLTTLRSENAHFIDYVVFAGPTGDDVIRRYRDLTGAAPLLPRWAYGYIHCRERFHSQAELLETLDEFRRRQFPLDVIVQDWKYWGKLGWNAMAFDPTDYPDPKAMIEQVHADHAHFMLSVWSRIDPTSAVGKEFEQKHLFIPGTEWVDFFNPEAAQLYWHDVSTHLFSLGVDAWWLDATEPENDDLHGRTVAIGSGDSVRLLYPLFVNKTVYEGQRHDAPEKRVFILTRSAFSGQQRYASAVWSGDVGSGWDALKRQITAGLDFSASGLPYWTTDTGGFFRPVPSEYTDPAYHERFLRWLEFSTFSPLMRVHGNQTDTEFWRFGPQVESVARKYVDLRYQLLPYLYSEAAAVTMKGSTLLRPLVMDFANDPTALEQKYEFMFGHELLVAPVVTPSTEHMNVYLPKHSQGWFNFWTGEHVAGGRTALVDARLDEIPVFVPAGSILPFGSTEQYASENKSDSTVDLRIYPGADATFDLYEDEGTNYDYERGQFTSIRFRWNERNHELVIGKRVGAYLGMAKQRQFCVRIVGSSQKPRVVTYVGRELHLSLN